MHDNTFWYFLVVHGSPNTQLRRKLWKDLARSKLDINVSWLTMGDFNVVTGSEEVGDNGDVSHYQCSRFTDWTFTQNLLDLGYVGNKFTWSRGIYSSTLRSARLDRAMCDFEWRNMFPNAMVQHLPRVQSDHAPLLLNLNLGNDRRGGNHFKTLAAWFLHEGFKPFVDSRWDQN